MNPERLVAIERIFSEGCGLAPKEREEFLRLACGEDRQLLEELRALYRHHDALAARPPPRSRASSDQRAEKSHSPPVVPGFQNLVEIGRGGQGVVYRAIQESTGQLVALKILTEARFFSQDARQRFEREIEVIGKLQHPHIVSILDRPASGDCISYAMKWVDGEAIDKYADSHSLDINDRLRLFLKVCEAIGFAHQQRVIHRDLKPSNILVDQFGEPRILDFGLAKVLDRDLGSEEVSVTGQILGTFAYMSPEQAEGRGDVDMRSDVYSLGVILYELLAGKRQYVLDGKQLSEVLRTIRDVEPDSLTWINPKVSGEEAAVTLKAQSKSREKRYETAGALAKEVTRLLNGEPVEAKLHSTFYLLRKHLFRALKRYAFPASVAAVIFFLALTTVVVLYESGRKREAALDELRREADAEIASSYSGRRERALEKLKAAAATRVDPQLRGDSAAALGLWDSRNLPLEGVSPERMEESSAWSVSLTADGKFLASATPKGPVVWDTHSGKMLTPPENWVVTLTDAGGQGGAVAFRPDGSLLAVATANGNVELWEFDGITLQMAVPFPCPEVSSLTFSPDGNLLATAYLKSPSRGVRLWRLGVANPVELRAVEEARSVAFSFDGNQVALGFANGQVQVFETVKLALGSPMVSTGGQGDVTVLAWHPDSITLAAGSDDGSVSIRDISIRESIAPWHAQGFGVYGLSFSGDGERLASCGWAGGTSLFIPTSGLKILQLAIGRADQYARSLSASRDGSFVACGGNRGVGLCRITGPVGQWTRTVSSTEVEKVAFSPDGNQFATLSHNWAIDVWQTDTGERLKTLRGRPSLFPDNACLAFSPSGRRLAYVNYNGIVEAWDGDKMTSPWTWDLKSRGLSSRLRFLDEERLVVVRHEAVKASGKNVVRAFNLNVGEKEPRIRFQWLSPGDNVFDSGEITADLLYPWLGPQSPPHERRLRLMDISNGQEITGQPVRGIEGIAADSGANITLRSGDGSLFWANEYANGAPIRSRLFRVTRGGFIAQQSLESPAAGFPSPDGLWYAAHQNDRISLWNLPQGQEAVSLRIGPGNSKAAVVFSPNGRHLVCGTAHGMLTCFDLPALKEALKAHGLAW